MNSFLQPISVSDILKLYSIIKEYHQRDKNSICLGLDVLSVNILDWYRGNMNMAKELLDGEKIKYGHFFSYAHSDERASVVRESADFVEKVLTPYVVTKVPEKKNVSTQLDVEVYRFADEALEPKVKWLGENKDEDVIKVDRNKVEDWMLTLKNRKQEIEKCVSGLRTDLKCQPTMDKDLTDKIRAYIKR